MYDIPILFVIFKRKDIALQSFQQIKAIKPQKLYIAGDGARNNVIGEAEKVDETRQSILNDIDWKCDVHTLFRNNNVGCSEGVHSAINWMFETEEMGIILEDDCIAEPTFFPYISELLHKYKDDYRIGMIAGTNPIENYLMPHSYCFSKYAACWGWATWKRAWTQIDIKMRFLLSAQDKKNILQNRGYQAKEKQHWLFQIDYIKKARVSAWDWQWYFSLAAQNQLCIFPQVNLISNIGNDTEATHTNGNDIFIKSKAITSPLSHPRYIVPDDTFDREFYRKDNTLLNRIKRNIPFKLKEQIKKIIR
ncbi:hypothetical protein [Prevotella sp. HUN102]|uniref:hypothetical protein n=1 Tax=Prevotella sp. HUN102 TaxID=1392486 RepID=UPI00048B684C|nr:hypothetical protein [Prevotella sp. HUN102]